MAISRWTVSPFGFDGTALPPVASLSNQRLICARGLRANPHGALPMHRLAGFFAALFIVFGSISAPALAQDKTLTVFAAASMKNALDDIDAAYTARTGVKIAASYAASSALAKQIEQGAPADIFVSADTDWM